MTLEIAVPRALAPLLKPLRYKGAYGGRGGAKSHFFAEQLVLRCYARETRAACIREVQATIKDSVRQLLIDKIKKFNLGNFFQVLDGEIRGSNGSLIIFKGMQAYNADNIKSLEGFDIAWVEEAQTFSEKSLNMLRPTLRKAGSELWFSWNPRYDSDAVDKFFRGGRKITDGHAVSVNWYDNPWFPDVLRQEKEDDYADDPEVAEHIWGGGYEIITEGAYYAKHIAAAEKEGRVGWFPHNPLYPVFTSWDLGVEDYTAIWFWQVIDDVPRVIDYYEASGFGADEIMAEALPEYTEDLQDRVTAMIEIDREEKFTYAQHFFPHDIKVREWGAGAKTRIQTVVGLGIKLDTIHRGAAQNNQDRVNASRRLLPLVCFHQSKRVMLGLARLRRYSRKKNKLLGTYGKELHDENSHGADAFGEFAVNCGLEPKKKPEAKPPVASQGRVPLPLPPEPSSGKRISL